MTLTLVARTGFYAMISKATTRSALLIQAGSRSPHSNQVLARLQNHPRQPPNQPQPRQLRSLQIPVLRVVTFVIIIAKTKAIGKRVQEPGTTKAKPIVAKLRGVRRVSVTVPRSSSVIIVLVLNLGFLVPAASLE